MKRKKEQYAQTGDEWILAHAKKRFAIYAWITCGFSMLSLIIVIITLIISQL